jgi:hypothetical protein
MIDPDPAELPIDGTLDLHTFDLRIPTQSGHPFRRKPATDSD